MDDFNGISTYQKSRDRGNKDLESINADRLKTRNTLLMSHAEILHITILSIK